jgi:hypothetical protein
MLMLLAGGGGLPVGIPPLAEDPVLARIAPEECLAYASWAGTAVPDAKSKNQAEQLLAEPEVQHLLSEVERMIVAQAIQGPNKPAAAGMAGDAFRWGKKLLMRPVAVFVSSVGLGPGGLDLKGGLIANVGEDVPQLQSTLEKYQALLPGGAEKVQAAGMSCYRLKLGPGAPEITWGMRGKYLLVAAGEGSLEGMVQRGRGTPPAWLAALRKQLPVERLSTVTYVNVKRVLAQFGPLAGPQAVAAFSAAGLDNVTSLAAVSGLDDEGLVTRMLVGIEGEPAGVFALAAGKPLAAGDLAPIPRDANFAVAARLDAAQVLQAVLAVAGKLNPQFPEEFDAGLRRAEAQLGVDLRKDVLGSLGDTWCVYNSSDEGGLIATGLTAVVRVKDYERLSAAHAKLLAVAKAALAQGEPGRKTAKIVADEDFEIKDMTEVSRPTPTVEKPALPANRAEKAPVVKAPGSKKKPPSSKMEEEEETEERAVTHHPSYTPYTPPRPRIEQIRFAEQEIYFLSGGNGMPFAPAWCLTPKALIVAAFPQQIKAYLSRGADFTPLAAAPDVANLLRPAEAPLALGYFDGRKVLDYVYPFACMGLQMASGEIAREGLGLNVSIIPSAPAIYRHLRPSSTAVRRTEAGIEVIGRGTLPGGGLGAILPLATGLMYSARSEVQSSRGAAQRAMSMNNMKQIGLAMQIYVEAEGHFPPAYSADKKTGKPLLSWRVALLPYLERDDLYKQFHLDEPWDSEHNKKLSETAMMIYRSPGSHAAANMTNYLTARGPDTAFPGKDGVTPAQITDGLSGTILIVEASDAKAVPWAKPDDLAYDEKQPLAGLMGLWPGGFYAAFCDGSVHFLPATIDAETLRRLFNRHDGKPVNTNRF